jgi:hypothetical protein
MATQRTILNIELSGNTTDGTTAVIIGPAAIPTGASAIGTLKVVGRDSTGATVTAMQSTGLKNTAGSVSLVGSITNLIGLTGELGLLTSVVSMDANSGNLRAKVTGVTAKNIEWWGYLEVIIN